MVLFWVVVLLLIFYFVKLLAKGTMSGRSGKSAVEILKGRYARGEISRDQYERMKEDIRS